ncbi:MAG: hypothetical protein COA44_10375 [Arcobacter sp.]|nr:MAG: hypothetical protein COA44_10375 [Arcobacter sp.]
MSSHKDHTHLEKIQDGIKDSTVLSDEEKTLTMRHIDEWLLEDRAEGTLYNELINLASGIKPMLAELGLI